MESRRQRFLKTLVRTGKEYKRMKYPVVCSFYGSFYLAEKEKKRAGR